MLTGMASAPIAAVRAGCGRARNSVGSPRSESVERLTAGVASFDVVPVRDLLLAELPAQEDLAAVDQRREVDQPAVHVTDDDALGLEAPEEVPHLEERQAY